jgi:putative transposase
MAEDHRRLAEEIAQGVLLDDPAFLRQIVERVLQELLEAEMTEHIGAAPYERSQRRKGHRNGHKPRTLRTRVGTLNLLVPQGRDGTFSTRLFSRYQRNEKALVLALMEMIHKPPNIYTSNSNWIIPVVFPTPLQVLDKLPDI